MSFQPSPLASDESASARTGTKTSARFPCSSCGADMQFDPRASAMKCPYCGHVEAMRQDTAAAPVVELALEPYLQIDPAQLGRMSATALEVTCSGCGSSVTFEPPMVAGECPFCGAKIVAQPRLSDPLLAPAGVLPFAITHKDAAASIRKWTSTRWFAPNALKQQAEQSRSQGVYLPFWTYDANTVSVYRGERGIHYTDSESYTDSDGRQQTRTVTRTDWYPAAGTVAHGFDDVLIAASRSVPRNRVDALEPWGLENIQPYDPAFLSGFQAQRYQIDLATGFEQAKQVMGGVIYGLVCQSIGGDEQRVHSIETSYSGLTFKHLLLPVYISAYRYQGRVFQVIVNARTGEVQGERPYSAWKIGMLVVAILILIVTIVYFANSSR